jgi:hypothetical protein
VPTAIITVRSPVEVARSLEARDGLGLEQSLLIWLRHMLDVEKETRIVSRVFVPYDDLLTDWRGVADKIAATAGVTWPVRPEEVDREISEFLSPSLRHHTAGLDALDVPMPLAGWVRTTWEALDVLARSTHADIAQVHERLDRVKDEFDRLTSIFGPGVRAERRAYGSEIARLTQARDDIEADKAANERERTVLTERVSGLEAERAGLMQRIAGLEQRADDAEALGATLRGTIAELHKERETLRTELAATRTFVDAVLKSKSWRLTAPLRAVAGIFVRRHLRQ